MTAPGHRRKAAIEAFGSDPEPDAFAIGPADLDEAIRHQAALPHMGLLLGEMWDLDLLAADCATDGVYEFLLSAQPLPFTGAVGSPVNPMALK